MPTLQQCKISYNTQAFVETLRFAYFYGVTIRDVFEQFFVNIIVTAHIITPVYCKKSHDKVMWALVHL